MPIKNHKPFCVGLTGGIGSGKTTVADFFSKLQVPIIDADVIAHQLTNENAIGYQKILDHFGKNILNADKTIDRKKLRDIIFENKSEKKWLENLLHPLIRQKMINSIEKIKSSYCICVIPLLAESTGIDFIDHVLVIDTSTEIQIARAKKRDAATHESIQKIIGSQASKDVRLKMANDILTNDENLASLEKNVYKLHQKYLEQSKKQT